MPRTAGLRGRLPVKPEGERFAIRYLGEYLAGPLPAPVYPVDVSGGIAPDAWLMLGNGPDPSVPEHPEGCGDCGFAGRLHAQMAKAAAGGEPMPSETAAQLVAEYFAYDHGQDAGVNLADVLLFWYQQGRVLAFAPVDHTDKAAVDSAGLGRVLVVDGGGSLRHALLGGNLGAAAARNGWAGVVIDGCVRDLAELAQQPLGIRALAAMPLPTEKRNQGQTEVPVHVQGVRVRPGDWLYADEDGIVVSARCLL